MRNSIVVAIAVCFVIAVLSFASCERSGRRGDGVTSRFGTGETGSGLDENSSSAGSNPARTLSIEQAIADARKYTPPAELANNAQFDPLVFEMLRAEFIRQIEERYCNPVERPVMDASWESGYVPKTGHCTGLDGGNGSCTDCGSI